MLLGRWPAFLRSSEVKRIASNFRAVSLNVTGFVAIAVGNFLLCQGKGKVLVHSTFVGFTLHSSSLTLAHPAMLCLIPSTGFLASGFLAWVFDFVR